MRLSRMNKPAKTLALVRALVAKRAKAKKPALAPPRACRYCGDIFEPPLRRSRRTWCPRPICEERHLGAKRVAHG